MPRSTKSQSKHDVLVKKLARQYQDKGYDVDADLEGWKKPESIGGLRPDIRARKDSHETALEVETPDSEGDARAEKQRLTFKDWAKNDPKKHFKKVVTEE